MGLVKAPPQAIVAHWKSGESKVILHKSYATESEMLVSFGLITQKHVRPNRPDLMLLWRSVLHHKSWNTLIFLINVKSGLPILKNSNLHRPNPPQKKIPPPQNSFFLRLHKNCVSCKSNIFYPISQLFKRRGLLAAIFQPPHLLILQLLHPLNVYFNLYVY